MNPPATALLRARHQHSVWTRSVWIAVAGLALELVLARLGVEARVRWWVLGVTAGLVTLARLWPQRTLRGTARELDQTIGARNRLEAVAELGGRSDAFARALRAEVDAFLGQHPLPRAYSWLAGLALLMALSAVNLATLVSGRARPMVAPAATVASASPAAVADEAVSLTARLAPPAGGGALRWLTPGTVAMATANEEIPLEAEAETATGLRQVLLHVALNGEPLPPFSIPGTIAAGIQPVVSSLPLAGFETKPYDLVTYYLEAERMQPADTPANSPAPKLLSPLQLVQIRPLRDEPLAGLDREDAAGRVLEDILQLERDQLGVLREAFNLAHEAAAPGNPARVERMRAAEARQTAVGQAAAATIPAVETAGIPSDASAALRQAEQEAREAAASLARGDAASARAAAGRALARLSAAEKSAADVVRANRARRAAEAAAGAGRDAKAGQAGLPERELTAAGRLENLAAQQKSLAERLALRRDPGGIFAEQDRLARALTKLAAERALPNEINDAIKSAADAATEAARQLNDQDALAATEPAARAAQTLGDAAAALDAAGRARAVEEMLAAQQAFIRAATELQMAAPKDFAAAARDAAQRTAAAQQNLQAAAQRQQERGSAAAAQKLDELAKSSAKSAVQQELAEAAKQAGETNAAQQKQQADAASQKLTELAQRAADAAIGMEGARKAGERALADLKRVQANLERAAERQARPLRWVNPNSDTTAVATETVALRAEASSPRGFSQLALHVSVNGAPRPPMILPAEIGAGVHPVEVSLELAPLKLKPDDTVSYSLLGELKRPTVPAKSDPPGPATPATSEARARPPGITLDLGVLGARQGSDLLDVLPDPSRRPATSSSDVRTGAAFTPTQIITIVSPKEKAAKGGVAETDDKNPRSFKARMLYLQKLQRQIVDVTFAVERGQPPPTDPSWGRTVNRILTTQDRNLAMTVMLRNQLQAALDRLEAAALSGGDPGPILDSIALEAPASAIFDLEEATDEMERATRELGRPNPPAALPPATRALAALTRILKPNAQADSAEAAPGKGKGDPKSDAQPAQKPSETLKEGAGQPQQKPAEMPQESSPEQLSPAELAELYTQTVASAQRADEKMRGAPIPPPPGPGSTVIQQRDFAELLAQRVGGIVQLSATAPRESKRAEVLTTGNPADAPPAYRSAVADYFEALARDRAAAPPPAP